VPIQQNPAHVYLTALPLTSSKSLISTYFRQRFPAVLQIDVDMDEEPQPVLTAAVSGNMIAVVIANSSLKVFDLALEGSEVFHAAIDPIPLKRGSYGEELPTSGYCLSISHNRMMVALGRIGCDVWRLADSTRRLPLPATEVAEVHITCLAFSDDGEHISAGFDDGTLCEWAVDSGMEGRRFAWPDGVDDLKGQRVKTVVYAQTDDRIISGCRMSSGPTRFFIWSRSGDCTFSYLLPDSSYSISISFARWLISFRIAENSTRRWQIRDLLTGELKFECYPQPEGYRGRSPNDWDLFTPSTPILAISSDGKLAAFGSDFLLFIWDVHENLQLAELVGHSGLLTSVTFAESHGDSKYRLVTTSLDGTIRLWDLDQLLKPKEAQHPMTSWGLCPKADEYGWRGGAWVQNGNGECLFWLPAFCPIRHPLNTLVIGRCAELDMTNFVHGEDWTKCRGFNVDDKPSDAERLT
jgi:WD40 repeat protein